MNTINARQRPLSFDKKNSSYTVPKGRWAKIVDNFGDLTINGVLVGYSKTSGPHTANQTITMRVKEGRIGVKLVQNWVAWGSGSFSRVTPQFNKQTDANTLVSISYPETVVNAASVSGLQTLYGVTDFPCRQLLYEITNTNSTFTSTATFYTRYEGEISVPGGTVLNGYDYTVILYAE